MANKCRKIDKKLFFFFYFRSMIQLPVNLKHLKSIFKDLVKCIPPLDVTKASEYFKATTKINSDGVYELHSCKVSGNKKIDCGIRCKSAVNCGKKCHSKAIMVRGTFLFYNYYIVSYVDTKKCQTCYMWQLRCVK